MGQCCCCWRKKKKWPESEYDEISKHSDDSEEQISLLQMNIQYLDHCDCIQLQNNDDRGEDKVNNNGSDQDSIQDNDKDNINSQEKNVNINDHFVLSKFIIYFGQFNIETCKKEGKGLILQRQFDTNFNSSYFHYEGQFMDDQIVGSGKLFNQKSKIILQEGNWLSISKKLNSDSIKGIKPQENTSDEENGNSKEKHEKSKRQFHLNENTGFHDQQLNLQDLNILKGKQWLNSSIIDAYIDHLNQEDEILYWTLSGQGRRQYQRLQIIPSWLFSWFHQGQDEQNLKYFKEIYSQFEPIQFRIWEIYKKIGFVINEQNRHWYFVQLDFEKMKMIVKDSMKGSFKKYASTLEILNNLFNKIDQKIKFILTVCQDCKQQNNSYDCGAYTCMNAKVLAGGNQKGINTGSDMRKVMLNMFLQKN